VPKLHVELDGAIRSGALVLKDGVPQGDVSFLNVCLDSMNQSQLATIGRTRVIEGEFFSTAKEHIITKATLTLEYQEA
jgi:hypothetical protein